MGVSLLKGPAIQTEFKSGAEEKAYKQKMLKYKTDQATIRKNNRAKLIYFFNNSDETKFFKWEKQLPDIVPKSTETGQATGGQPNQCTLVFLKPGFTNIN